ncbi:MAG TPA: hypothetical protein VFW65_32130 [Pseudonocardiaceae bacterium]|nr:hypothetical protein [Pseudonocardiaceae bacterium]
MVAEVPFEQTPNFSYALNDPGSGSVMVPLGGNGMSPADIEELTQPWRWTWAVAYRDFLCQAGPVVSEQYTGTQPYTEVTFAGIWKLLTKRLAVPATFTGGNPAMTANDTTYSTVTYRQVAKNLVATSLARGGLPIVLPADDPPGPITQQYFGYDMNLVADMLTNLTGLSGGPEIEFRPQFDPTQPGFLQWVMRVGSPRLGQLGSPWVWDYGSRGAVQEFDTSRDGSSMTFSDYVRGSGSQYTLLVGNAQDLSLVDAGYPLLEDVNGDHTTVTDVPTAASYAQQWVDTYKFPVNTPTVAVRVDGRDGAGRGTGSPTLDQISVGDTASFVVQGHRRLPDGTYTYRITGVTQGTDQNTAALTLQPVTGVG